jgi:ABC-type antimicrobial peptide transport system permease subunit
MARPLDTMSFFAGIVVWIVVVNAIVIISLVTALTLKTREYEIGVLLSIGVSKLKVVGQLFLELIIVAFIGFALASVSGSLMAGRVGDMVLDFQTTSEAQYEEQDSGYVFVHSTDYFTSVTQDDLLAEYHVSVSPLLIGEIFLLGTGVVLIAIVIPSFMIMRLNPKQILLEQN